MNARDAYPGSHMLSLSQTTGYAIKALGCLNDPACHSRNTPEIARRTGVPKPYLAKIVNSLARQGLVASRRGVGGGITLARPPEEISLLQIVEAVEGKDWLGECLLGLDECSNLATCPTHDFWERIRREITQELNQITLASVIAFRRRSRGRRSKRQSLKEPT
jgi:Rrf2 family transcriptional regulator, iron-sulfur cluster assembly transcription factor